MIVASRAGSPAPHAWPERAANAAQSRQFIR